MRGSYELEGKRRFEKLLKTECCIPSMISWMLKYQYSPSVPNFTWYLYGSRCSLCSGTGNQVTIPSKYPHCGVGQRKTLIEINSHSIAQQQKPSKYREILVTLTSIIMFEASARGGESPISIDTPPREVGDATAIGAMSGDVWGDVKGDPELG